MVLTCAVPVKGTRGASIPLFRLFRSGMCSMPTVTRGVFQVYHIMFNSFSILYQTYLSLNLFLPSFHEISVSFFKTAFWLYESFICMHFFKLILSSKKVQTNFYCSLFN
jgi:hypothetical protein